MGLLDALAQRIASTASRGVGLLKAGVEELSEQEKERRRKLQEKARKSKLPEKIQDSLFRSSQPLLVNAGLQIAEQVKPGSTKKVREKAMEVVKTSAQDTARYTGGLGLGIGRAGLQGGKYADVIPEEIPTKGSRIGRTVFGGRPVPTTIKSTAKSTLEDFGLSEGTANKYSSGKLALPIAVAGSTMNIIPGGKAAKAGKFAKELVPELTAILARTADFGANSKITQAASDALEAIQKFGDKANPTVIREAKEAIEFANKQLKRTETRPGVRQSGSSMPPETTGLQTPGLNLAPDASRLPLEVSPPNLSRLEEARKRISAQVGEDKPGIFRRAINKPKGLWQDIKDKWVDSFSPIADAITRAERQGLTIKDGKVSIAKIQEIDDPRLLRERTLGATDIAKSMLREKIEPVLKRIGVRNLDEFNQYLAARQSITAGDLGKETGISAEDAKTFVNAYGPQYEEAAKEVTAYTQQVLKYIQEGGLISEDVYNALVKRYPNYVPLNRVMDELEATGSIPRAQASLGQVKSVQKLEGSTRQIKNPLESIVDRTLQATHEVEVNRVAQAVAGLRVFDQFKDLIRPLRIIEETQKRVSKKGKEFTTVVKKTENVPSGAGTISVFENGVKQIYVVPKEIEEAAKNLNKQAINPYLRVLSLPTRLARLGITGINPAFILSNIVKDVQFGILNSDHVFRTSILNPFNFTMGLMSAAGKGKAYRDFIRAGGGSSTFFSVGRENAGMTVKQLASGRTRKIARTITHPRELLDFVENVVSVAEQGPRVAAFRGTLKGEGGKLGLDVFAPPTRESLLAVSAGRNTTVDFAKAGGYGRMVNMVHLYFNAGIQGSRNVAQSFRRRPISTTFKVATTLYAPVVAAQLWNNATEERRKAWNDIPNYEKNNHFIVLPPNPVLNDKGQYDNVIKIRMPDTFNALTIPLRFGIDEMLGNDEETVQQMLWETLSEASPVDLNLGAVMPQATRPILETTANYDYFTERPIVSERRQKLPPEQQVGVNTSALVKSMAGQLKYSPAKLQHLIKGYTGGVGLQVLNAVDRGMYLAGLIEAEEIGGNGLLEDIRKRFRKVSGGQEENEYWTEVKKYQQEAAGRQDEERQSAEKIYEELHALPRTEWKSRLRELKNDGVLNERIYNRIKTLDKEDRSGITDGEKAIKRLAVDERSLWLKDQLVKLPKNERLDYMKSLKEKGILTKSVYDAFNQLEDKPEF